MRILKEPEERKNEILDAAQELFAQKGFDGTSTSDILDNVGIARGTLYYHFKSKEDIMNALIQRYNTQILTATKKISEDKSTPILERIIGIVAAINVSGGEGQEIIEHIHKPQNALMHNKIQDAIVNSITPILADLVREGNEQGIFDTPFPYESMEMVIIYLTTICERNKVQLIIEKQKEHINALAFNIERLFGAEKGSFRHVVEAVCDGIEPVINSSEKSEVIYNAKIL